jgi:hypothetical protein
LSRVDLLAPEFPWDRLFRKFRDDDEKETIATAAKYMEKLKILVSPKK